MKNLDLQVVDACYLETKKIQLNWEDERRRKCEETRNERENGWTRAPCDEDAWSDDDESNEKE